MLLKKWGGLECGPAWVKWLTAPALLTSHHAFTLDKGQHWPERERAQLGNTEMSQTRGGVCVGWGGRHLGSMSVTVPVSESVHPYACWEPPQPLSTERGLAETGRCGWLCQTRKTQARGCVWAVWGLSLLPLTRTESWRQTGPLSVVRLPQPVPSQDECYTGVNAKEKNICLGEQGTGGFHYSPSLSLKSGPKMPLEMRDSALHPSIKEAPCLAKIWETIPRITGNKGLWHVLKLRKRRCSQTPRVRAVGPGGALPAPATPSKWVSEQAGLHSRVHWTVFLTELNGGDRKSELPTW